MADLTITAANVIKGTGASTKTGVAGATITAGQTVYMDASDSNKIKLADANASSATAACIGIALHAALAGQPITYQDSGIIALGSILTAGAVYVLSATAGGIAPVADLTTGWRSSVLGIAKSTGNLELGIHNSDTAIA